ncbi:MAG: hypothetical protein L3J97_03150 [Thermoplasmata archaeon]|nr:hypothetical protein [Thermoplasmata archaeon]
MRDSVLLEEAPFLGEVERIVKLAEERGVVLRACGSVGLYYRLRGVADARAVYLLRDGTARPTPLFKDLDLASREKHSSKIYRLLVQELGYTEDRETNALFGMYRNVYFHPAFSIDIFYDALRFSHEIPLKDRFPAGVTLAPEDLLLSKLQIHKTTPRDSMDLAAGVLGFPVAQLDRTYLSGILGDDWGFWYDADLNLRRSADLVSKLPTNGNPAAVEVARRAEHRLKEYIDFLAQVPKTRKWEKRKAKGTAEPWFEDVDELH